MRFRCSILFLAAIVCPLLSLGGCSQSRSPQAAGDSAGQASSGDAALENGDAGRADDYVNSDNSAAGDATGTVLPAIGNPSAPAGSPSGLNASETPLPLSDLQIPQVSNFATLSQFLLEVDREIQRLATIPEAATQRDELVREVRRVAMLKRQAADLMLQDESLDLAQKSLAVRAKMQALSHQAALGDLPAAEQLEKLAQDVLAHPVADVARDSRTVLLGFALERLQSGLAADAQEVLKIASELCTRPDLLDTSTLKAIQQTLVVLQRYGYANEARQVRGNLTQILPQLTPPSLQQLAQGVLAETRFSDLEQLRLQIADETLATTEKWGELAANVAQQYPDGQTVAYLSNLALQLEAMDRVDHAAAVYGVIDRWLTASSDPQAASGARQCLAAYRARQQVIGQSVSIPFDQTMSGKPVAASDLQGKTIVMPLWAASDPASLNPIPALEELANNHPEKVALLGINLDVSPEARSLASQIADQNMTWPSLWAANAQGDPFANPVLAATGVVSLPAVVIIDPQGKVVAVALSQSAVERALRPLLPTSEPFPPQP